MKQIQNYLLSQKDIIIFIFRNKDVFFFLNYKFTNMKNFNFNGDGPTLYLNAKVFLNVYDLKSWLNCCQCIGIGAYHTAVQVNGVQYFYWGTGAPSSGILEIAPESMREFKFSRKIEMGEIYLPLSEFNFKYHDIRSRFIGSKYDLLSRNCNHFSQAFIQRLLGIGIPPYLFRMSNFLQKIRCIIPDCFLGPNGIDPFQKLNRRLLGLAIQQEDIKIVNF